MKARPAAPRLRCRVWLRLPALAVASDFHLDPLRAGALHECFCAWLSALPADVPLALLGDVFDFWLGDDWAPPALEPVFAALTAASRKRTIFFQAGNRDFLAGRRLAKRLGWRRLPALAGVLIGNRRYLLTHGDALCWQDEAYMAWYAQCRDRHWQGQWLRRPLEERLAFAQAVRAQSRERKDYPTDVSSEALADLWQCYPRTELVHGHTHQPAHHMHDVVGTVHHRYVLPAWEERPGWLRLSANAEPKMMWLSADKMICSPRDTKT